MHSTSEFRNAFLRTIRQIIRESVRNMAVPTTKPLMFQTKTLPHPPTRSSAIPNAMVVTASISVTTTPASATTTTVTSTTAAGAVAAGASSSSSKAKKGKKEKPPPPPRAATTVKSTPDPAFPPPPSPLPTATLTASSAGHSHATKGESCDLCGADVPDPKSAPATAAVLPSSSSESKPEKAVKSKRSKNLLLRKSITDSSAPQSSPS